MSSSGNDKYIEGIQEKLYELSPALRKEYENFQKQIPSFVSSEKFARKGIFWGFAIFVLGMFFGNFIAGVTLFLLFFFIFIYFKTHSEFSNRAMEISAKTGLPWTTSKGLLEQFHFSSSKYNFCEKTSENNKLQQDLHQELSPQFNRSSINEMPAFKHYFSEYKLYSSIIDRPKEYYHSNNFRDVPVFTNSYFPESHWNSPAINPTTGFSMSSGGVDMGGYALGYRRDW